MMDIRAFLIRAVRGEPIPTAIIAAVSIIAFLILASMIYAAIA